MTGPTFELSCPRCSHYALQTPALTCCWCQGTRLVPYESANQALPVWERGACHCDTCNNLRGERGLAHVPPPVEEPVLPETRVNGKGETQIKNSKGWWTTLQPRKATAA